MSTMPDGLLGRPEDEIPRGTPAPKLTVEIWSSPDLDSAEQLTGEVADVVRIGDHWHVVVVLDD